MPLSTYLVVNEDDFLDVIDQMRTAIPQEIKEGKGSRRERERIVAQAEEEAERIVQLAQEEAAKLVEEHEAHPGRRTSGPAPSSNAPSARPRCSSVRPTSMPEGYCSPWMTNWCLDDQIDDLLMTVRNGLETLHPKRRQA